MRVREADKEILGRDPEDFFKLIAKGMIDIKDLIAAYRKCGEHKRADTLCDALKLQSALGDVLKIIGKYSSSGKHSPQSSNRFGLFNQAYAHTRQYHYSPGIDYVGTDIHDVGDAYLALCRKR